MACGDANLRTLHLLFSFNSPGYCRWEAVSLRARAFESEWWPSKPVRREGSGRGKALHRRLMRANAFNLRNAPGVADGRGVGGLEFRNCRLATNYNPCA
jgi:hypothetical protein